MTGSWAGAMGQSQFMPSSYQAYAVDYDGDGRRDIWASLPDVFASIANYLARAGWNDELHLGPRGPAAAAIDGELVGPASGAAAAGVAGARRAPGRRRATCPRCAIERLAACAPTRARGPPISSTTISGVLMAWNRSTYFALTVGELADLIDHG